MTVAADLFPGGVNSPVRAYRAVGGEPPVLVRGEGAVVWDEAGRRYIDYVGAFGPLLLGHANRGVVEAIHSAAEAGGSFGVTGPGEVRLAQLIRKRMPSIERIRFVNSGTEAAMSALRVARAATGRDLIVKFDGGYHGHADSLLVEAGSGVATLSIPGSAGVGPPDPRDHPRQRPRFGRGASRVTPGTRGRGHSGADRGQHGRCRARDRISKRIARADRTGWRAPHLR